MIEMNRIYNEDCLEFMKRVPDKYFDLVLTDPPYGLGNKGLSGGREFSKKYKKSGWEDTAPGRVTFEEMFRISKNQIIWGANYFNLPASKCFLVWDKKQPYDFTLAMVEQAFCSIDYPAKMFSHSVQIGKKYHPTQKPIKLMEFCVEFARSREDIKTVFDPFMGSGTTAVACQSLGLQWCGCELEPDYVAIANKRLEQVQGALF